MYMETENRNNRNVQSDQIQNEQILAKNQQSSSVSENTDSESPQTEKEFIEIESTITTNHDVNEEINNQHQKIMHSDIFSMICRIENEPEIQYIWSGIKKGTFGYVYGPAKSGKTIVCENLGMSIAAKIPSFLGISINHTGIENVLFISMEEFWKNRSERNQKQVSVLIDVNAENFKYSVVNENFPLSMDNKKSWDELERTIVESKADLVFIDSFTRLTWDEVEKSKVGSEISRNLKDLTNRLNITMIVIHHSSKITNSPLELWNMAGSRVVGQEADFILGINKLTNGTRYFKEVATRYKQEDEMVTTFSIGDNLWIKKIKKIKEEQLFNLTDHRVDTGNEDLVYDTILDLQNPENEIKSRNIIAKLDGIVGQSRIYEILGSLERDGLIDRSIKGVVKLQQSPSPE